MLWPPVLRSHLSNKPFLRLGRNQRPQVLRYLCWFPVEDMEFRVYQEEACKFSPYTLQQRSWIFLNFFRGMYLGQNKNINDNPKLHVVSHIITNRTLTCRGYALLGTYNYNQISLWRTPSGPTFGVHNSVRFRFITLKVKSQIIWVIRILRLQDYFARSLYVFFFLLLFFFFKRRGWEGNWRIKVQRRTIVTVSSIRFQGNSRWTRTLVSSWFEKAEIAAESIVLRTIMRIWRCIKKYVTNSILRSTQ